MWEFTDVCFLRRFRPRHIRRVRSVWWSSRSFAVGWRHCDQL